MSRNIDLRTEKLGGTWVRKFGDHEANGIEISLGNVSAHLTPVAFGIMFSVDRVDVPSAWDTVIDVDKVLTELGNAIARKMSRQFMGELGREIENQRSRSFLDGAAHARAEIRAALGLKFNTVERDTTRGEWE